MIKQNDKITYVAQCYTNAETAGKVQDVTVFVPQMLVGEKALVKINHVKANVAYGDVVEMCEVSKNRVVPPCKHFGTCGGCTLMHMAYDEQLLFKQNKVATNLKKLGDVCFPVMETVPSEKVLGYRNKLSLPVRGHVGKVQIGMYKKGSHQVVDADSCLLGDSWSTTLVAVCRKWLNDAKILPYNEKTFKGMVRHIVARYVSQQLLVTVVTNGQCKLDFSPLVAQLQKQFENFGLFVNENSQKNNVILGNVTKHVFGLQYIEGNHLGVKFRLRPDSFFQVNDGVKDAIYQKVRQLLDVSKTQVLIDCFSGVGILTTVLASDKYVTYAVELEKSAVLDASEIAKLNNSPNVVNVCGDANVELPKIAAENADKRMSLVVDPPRKGLGEKICNTILQSDFDNIVYVSCDSATLARDLKMLLSKYRPDYVQPWDMFPNTAEVETVVHLVRKDV